MPEIQGVKRRAGGRARGHEMKRIVNRAAGQILGNGEMQGIQVLRRAKGNQGEMFQNGHFDQAPGVGRR